MEMARSERRAQAGVVFDHGTRLAHKMMEQEQKPAKERPRRSTVRKLLAEHPPSESTIDLRGMVNKFSGGEIWETLTGIASENSDQHEKSINLAGWNDVSSKTLRAISLSLGTNITQCDLSDTAINDADFQVGSLVLIVMRACVSA